MSSRVGYSSVRQFITLVVEVATVLACSARIEAEIATVSVERASLAEGASGGVSAGGAQVRTRVAKPIGDAHVVLLWTRDDICASGVLLQKLQRCIAFGTFVTRIVQAVLTERVALNARVDQPVVVPSRVVAIHAIDVVKGSELYLIRERKRIDGEGCWVDQIAANLFEELGVRAVASLIEAVGVNQVCGECVLPEVVFEAFNLVSSTDGVPETELRHKAFEGGL